MKYYIIAGEASGDLHASNLMEELKKADIQADFRFWGGDLMQAQGGKLVKHYRDLAFMGLYEVILNIRTIAKNLSYCKKDITEYNPDAIILVDYPGFNLRIAEFAYIKGFKTVYYISPKIWVWKKSRAFKIKKFINMMFVIFPFEVDFYKKYDYKVTYVGNPLLDELEKNTKNIPDFEQFTKENNLQNKPVIALVAGSRKQEIQWILPEMLKVIKYYPQYQFIITGASSIEPALYKKYTSGFDVSIIYNKTYQVLKNAKAALVTSGTATLETALLNIPQVVCYKTSPVTYHVVKHFVKPKFFSLPNIVMDRQIVKEILQFNLAEELKTELDKILINKGYYDDMLNNYKELKGIMGNSGASKRTAQGICEFFRNNK